MSEQERLSFEVWLTYDLNEYRVVGRLVHDDGTSQTFNVESPSVRRAQREVAARLVYMGYRAIGGWELEAEDSNGPLEVSSWYVADRPEPEDLAYLLRE